MPSLLFALPYPLHGWLRMDGWLIAQDGDGTATLPAWVNWGVLGLVVAAFIAKQLVPGWLYADIKRDNEALRAENRRLVDLSLDTQASTAPALAAATRVMDEMMTEVRILKRGSP